MISVTTRLTCEQEKDIAKTEYYDGHLQLFHGHSPARLIRSSKTCQSVWLKYLIGHLSSGIWSYMSLKRGCWRNSQVLHSRSKRENTHAASDIMDMMTGYNMFNKLSNTIK